MDRVQPFRLNLLGTFRLWEPDGGRVEISSKKGIALVAMLALARDGERSRDWLQDKLWGQRERQQAQSSLRRELSNLRRVLNTGPVTLLDCGPQYIRLDLRYIAIDVLSSGQEPGGSTSGGELLEGMDIPGADGFEEWLREQRRFLETRSGERRRGAATAASRADSSSGRVALVSVTASAAGLDQAAGTAQHQMLANATIADMARDQDGTRLAADDPLLFAFSEVRRAVAFATTLLRRNNTDKEWLAPGFVLQLKIGICDGDLAPKSDEPEKDTAQAAIDLCRSCPPGGVLISQRIRDALVEGLDPSATAIGLRRLPGAPEPVMIYRLETVVGNDRPREPDPISPETPATSHPAPILAGRPALAVLPFTNLTGDHSIDYLGEGISEDLIDRLSRLRWLPVISRGSSFSLASGSLEPNAIGEVLGAKYILEGRLRRVDLGLALTVSLTDSENGQSLWSQRVDLPAQHSQDAIDQIVAGLVAVLDARIDYAEQMRARGNRQNSPDFNELIWRGRWHVNRLTQEDSEIARKLFNEALALEPDSPEALIQATYCFAWSLWARRGTGSEITELRRMAQKAIIADPDDGRGHFLAGIAEMWLRQPGRARPLLRKAVELNPSLVQAYVQLGTSYNLTGEPELAVAPLETARRLSPNDVHIFYLLGELALTFWMLGRWDDAVEHAELSLIRRPAYWYAEVIKINALVAKGDGSAASRAYEELLQTTPDFTREHIRWIPFVDIKWVDLLIEGVETVSNGLESGSTSDAAGKRRD